MIFDKNGNVIKQIFDNYFRPKISDDGSIIAAAKSTPLNNIDIDIFDRGGMLLKTIGCWVPGPPGQNMKCTKKCHIC